MMPTTLHALWYSPILPILFLISAIAVGPAMVIFESTLSTKIFGHKLDTGVLGGLAKVLPFILGTYLLLRIFELMAVGEIGLIFTAYPYNLLWWGEIIIGVIIPIILFSIPDIRYSPKGVFGASVMVILGLMFNRFNVSMLALEIRPGFVYFPHWMEFAISAGLVADALLVVWLAYRFLPIVQKKQFEEVKV
jgi:Ni/Fe-hydrogenase subunit HybB-like protein